MRIVVYEPTPTGHHFAYLAHVIPALADLGCKPILLTTRRAAASSPFEQHLGAYANRLTVDESIEEIGPGTSPLKARRELSNLVRAVQRIRPDHLYVAYGDQLALAAGLARLVGPKLWNVETFAEVLLLRGGFTYRAPNFRSRVQARISPQLIRLGPWSRVHHLNADDLQVLQSLGGAFAARCHLMPDPVEVPLPTTKAEARRALGIPVEGRYVGCAGMIDRRKGVDFLISAFAAARNRWRPADRLLLAGPMATAISTQIEREMSDSVKKGEVVVLNRTLAPAEINLALSAMDLVCTPYPSHIHSASIVIRAAAVERPILTSAIGWMEGTVRRFQLGASCRVDDRGAFSNALVSSLDAAEEFSPSEAARRFVTFHSIPNFTAHWTAGIRERLGLAEDIHRIGWSWVLEALPTS